jgi:hypothetical protein
VVQGPGVLLGDGAGASDEFVAAPPLEASMTHEPSRTPTEQPRAEPHDGREGESTAAAVTAGYHFAYLVGAALVAVAAHPAYSEAGQGGAGPRLAPAPAARPPS